MFLSRFYTAHRKTEAEATGWLGLSLDHYGSLVLLLLVPDQFLEWSTFLLRVRTALEFLFVGVFITLVRGHKHDWFKLYLGHIMLVFLFYSEFDVFYVQII